MGLKIEKIYLIKNQKSANSGSLNNKIKLVLTKTIADARINQMGDQRQMTAFGKVYADARIVRLTGDFNADRIGLSNMNPVSLIPNFEITKAARHNHKTDFYIVIDNKQIGGGT